MTDDRRTNIIVETRKHPLREYILGILRHTTARDRVWGGDVFQRLFILGFTSHDSGLTGLLEL